MKLQTAVDSFLLAIRVEVASKQTVLWYRNRLARFVSFFGDCEFTSICLDDLRRFVLALQEQKVLWASSEYRRPVRGSLSVSTIHGYVRCIKRLYSWLEENGHITLAQNVALRLKKPKLPKQAPKAISDGDMVAILKASRNWGKSPKRNYAMLMFLAETGCRVGGLIHLRLSDMDLKEGRAIVTEKGSKTRAVFLGEKSKEALAAWLAERPDNSEYVFTGQRGPLSSQGVNMVLRSLKLVAGVKGRVNPHSFRHAFARRHLLDGGDVAFLSDLMGHSDIKVTKEAYSIFTTEELRQQHLKHSTLDKLL